MTHIWIEKAKVEQALEILKKLDRDLIIETWELAKTMGDLEQAIATEESSATQEPVAWLITDEAINSIQVASIQRLIDRLKHAHHTDLCVRINGQDEWYEADWIKHLKRVHPQPKAEQEPKREWINLSHEKKMHLNEALNLQGRFPIIDSIESAVREINK